MRFLTIVIAFASVAAAEISLHWYAGKSQTPLARSIRDAYLHLSGEGHQPMISLVVDIVVPAMVLGFLTGYLGVRWNVAIIALCAVVLLVGLVLLLPVYGELIPKGQRSPLWPDNEHFTLVGFYAGQTVNALVIFVFFACGGYRTAEKPKK